MFSRLAISLIKLYQITLSPDHSWRKIYYPAGFCRFYPSCSQYALDCLKQKPVWPAFWAIARRLWRCRPGSAPDYDPI